MRPALVVRLVQRPMWLACIGMNAVGTLLEAGTLDPRDRELVILRVGFRTHCAYEWTQHLAMARVAGLSAAQIAAVTEGPGAAAWTDRDRDLLRAADQLVDDHVVDAPTWARLARHFDERQLLELMFVVGSYVCLAMVLNSVGLDPTVEPDRAAGP